MVLTTPPPGGIGLGNMGPAATTVLTIPPPGGMGLGSMGPAAMVLTTPPPGGIGLGSMGPAATVLTIPPPGGIGLGSMGPAATVFTIPPPGGIGLGSMGPSANVFTDARVTIANKKGRSFSSVEIIGKTPFPEWQFVTKEYFRVGFEITTKVTKCKFFSNVYALPCKCCSIDTPGLS
jgi:hypothetical protein